MARFTYFNNKNRNSAFCVLIDGVSLLLENGATLTEALQITLESRHSNAITPIVTREIFYALQKGDNMLTACRAAVPGLKAKYLAILNNSEYSGDICDTFARLRSAMDQDKQHRQRLTNLLLYPAVLLLALLIFSAVVVALIPGLNTALASLGLSQQTLSVLEYRSQLLMTTTIICQLAVIVLPCALLFFRRKSNRARIFFDNLLLKIPIARGFFRLLLAADCCENLSKLLNGSTPLADALKICARSTRNLLYRQIILIAIAEIITGKQPLTILRQQQLFPEPAERWLQLATNSGNGAKCFSALARIYRQKIDRFLETFYTLLPPFFIMLIAGYLLVFFYLLILPLLTIYENFV